jgi:hypothetical protein
MVNLQIRQLVHRSASHETGDSLPVKSSIKTDWEDIRGDNGDDFRVDSTPQSKGS